MLITNPSAFTFKVSADPLVQGYDLYAEKVVDGAVVATASTDLGHLPVPDENGIVSFPASTLTDQLVAAGVIAIECRFTADAYGPAGVKSSKSVSVDSFQVVQLVGPTEAAVVA